MLGAAEVVEGELALERLEAEICELAGHLAAGECRWLLLLNEFDRREGWTGFGLQSCAHWLSHRCGVGLQAAREKLRVGRRLAELPLVREAFAAGQLSYSKVRAVSRVARAETESVLLELARYATTSQLEEIVRAYRSVTGREELRNANDRHENRFARWHWDDDGSLVLKAQLSPEDGAAVLAALQAGREAAEESQAAGAPAGGVGATGDSAESLPAATRNADALVAMAKLAVSAPAGTAPRPPQVVIVDRRTIRGESDVGRCHLDGGPAIPPETARRLACDAIVVAVVEAADGTPLDVGRKRRTPPAPLRWALRRRDRGCRFPGCGAQRFLHAHHVRHWTNGGETKLANLVLLCGRHHRLVHEGGYGVETPGNNVFVFLDRAGRVVPGAPEFPPVSGAGVAERNEAAGIVVTAETVRSLGEGEAYDLGLTIDVLVAASSAGLPPRMA